MRCLYSSDQCAPALRDSRAPLFSFRVGRVNPGLWGEFILFMRFSGSYYSVLRTCRRRYAFDVSAPRSIGTAENEAAKRSAFANRWFGGKLCKTIFDEKLV